MIHFADVLYDLVRRGLTLRIDPEGNFFIYERQRLAGSGVVVMEEEEAEGARAGGPVALRFDERGCDARGAATPRTGERGYDARGAVAPRSGERGCDARGAATPRSGERGCDARGAVAPRSGERGCDARGAVAPRSGERGCDARGPVRDAAAHSDDHGWRGITWRDVPGHDDHLKKLNFSLLKRGLLHGHKCCARLEGEPLKLRLQELSERNRQNSRSRQEKARAEKARLRAARPGPYAAQS